MKAKTIDWKKSLFLVVSSLLLSNTHKTCVPTGHIGEGRHCIHENPYGRRVARQLFSILKRSSMTIPLDLLPTRAAGFHLRLYVFIETLIF